MEVFIVGALTGVISFFLFGFIFKQKQTEIVSLEKEAKQTFETEVEAQAIADELKTVEWGYINPRVVKAESDGYTVVYNEGLFYEKHINSIENVNQYSILDEEGNEIKHLGDKVQVVNEAIHQGKDYTKAQEILTNDNKRLIVQKIGKIDPNPITR